MPTDIGSAHIEARHRLDKLAPPAATLLLCEYAPPLTASFPDILEAADEKAAVVPGEAGAVGIPDLGGCLFRKSVL